MGPRLSAKELGSITSAVQRPAYKRDDLQAGIVHIGVGNFHRAHQAFYLDSLFNLGEDHDWAIVGAGLFPSDSTRRQQLAPQDWMTTVVEMGPSGPTARVIGSMIDFVPVDPVALIDGLAQTNIRLVTLTITEGGYFIDPATGEFDVTNPAIVHDAENFDSPETVFGILLHALWQRRLRGVAPFTVLSCDNLLGNGNVTHRALVGLARMIDEVDADWVAGEVSCPNCMVDCITPATTDDEREIVNQKFGFNDAAPVFCERFRQWVIEDRFPSGRPALEKVGVQFTDDVSPFEELKLNILNAGHAAIAYPAALLDIDYAHLAMADEDVFAWLDTLLSREVVPNLNPAGDMTPDAYLQTVIKRFSNPAIKDSISRLLEDGENRQPKFIFPSIRRALVSGSPLDGLALEIALWCRSLAETTGACSTASRSALATKVRPAAFVLESGLFGDLIHSERFVAAFCSQIERLWRNGVRGTLRAYVEQA